jgi:hypothetical protein
MLELRNPLPVVTPLGEGYALYVRDGGTFENDVWCVVLDDARILHFRSNELRYVGNATLGLQRPATSAASVSATGSRLAESTQRLAAKAKGGGQ